MSNKEEVGSSIRPQDPAAPKPASPSHGALGARRAGGSVAVGSAVGSASNHALNPVINLSGSSAGGPQLALMDVLPGTRVGRAAVDTFDAMQQAAATQGWFAAAGVLAQRLRAARELRSHERRFVSDALNDLVRGLRRLRHLVSSPAAPSGAGKRPGALALYLALLCEQHAQAASEGEGTAPVRLPKVLLSTAGAAGLDTRALIDRIAGLRRDEARLAELAAEPGSLSRLAEILSYPDWIVRTLSADLGPERGLAVLRAQNQRAPLTVRANLLKGTRDELAARLRHEGVESTPTACAPNGLQLHTRVNAYGLASFQEGWFELQDEGSQLIAELVLQPPGTQAQAQVPLVLDACAGAGGKTLALGAAMHNRGRLIAVDLDRDKLEELRRRARRAGLTNVQVICGSMDLGSAAGSGRAAELPAELLTRGAGRVLVDAPCSGLGVLRRNPEARWRLRPEDLDEIGAKQRGILLSAARCVQPGGRLIYATCTVLSRENEAVVEALLRDRPDFSLVPAAEVLPGGLPGLDGSDGLFLRTLPAEGAGPDGFFAAVLQRRE